MSHDYSAKIVADSVNPAGDRITTFELTYPRFVHAELMTHRMFSRNSASSRAIPTAKLVERVVETPVLPKWWGKNQSGMQAREELSGDALDQVKTMWLQARDSAVRWSEALRDAGLHKQIANRIIEPWMFITVIVTATEWDNWYHLRDSEFAQPEIAWVARQMRRLHDENEPEKLKPHEWHLPYVELREPAHDLYVERPVGMEIAAWMTFLKKISTARCARVSYLTHDGKRDYAEDIKLHDRLSTNGHWSPFEHPAECWETSQRFGNFFGWRQYRKRFAAEHYGRKLS